MPRKNNNKSSKASLSEEPQVPYQKSTDDKAIRFFSSFEEMNEYDHKQMAALTPIQRLQNITRLIIEMYKQELDKPMTDMTIYFK